MSQGQRTIWLGTAAAVGLVMLSAFFFPHDTNAPSSASRTVSADAEARAAATARLAKSMATPEAEKLRQMIDSGKFAPPPGNTDAMYSIATPFARSIPTSETRISPDVPGNSPGAELIGLAGSTNRLAATVAKPTGPSAGTPSQPAATIVQQDQPPQVLKPDQPAIFETPPGIGSAKGGQ